MSYYKQSCWPESTLSYILWQFPIAGYFYKTIYSVLSNSSVCCLKWLKIEDSFLASQIWLTKPDFCEPVQVLWIYFDLLIFPSKSCLQTGLVASMGICFQSASELRLLNPKCNGFQNEVYFFEFFYSQHMCLFTQEQNTC